MNLAQYTLTWGNWLMALLVLVVFYYAIKLITSVLGRVNLLGAIQKPIVDTLEIVLKLYEPTAALLMLVIFVFINPFLHGLLVSIVLVLAFYPVKNYINGRLFLLAHKLKTGQRISIESSNGLIRKLGRLGISLQTQEGIRFINYTSLLSNGYMLMRGEKIGRLHRLLIHPTDELEANLGTELKNRLFSCPYIDWSLRPEIQDNPAAEHQYYLQVLVREEQHLDFLIELIREWGYECQLSD